MQRGERIEITEVPKEIKLKVPRKFNYEQAWKDLRNIFIDQITDKEDGTLYDCDLKKVMDEMLIDYEI